jgi:hypothetical protein
MVYHIKVEKYKELQKQEKQEEKKKSLSWDWCPRVHFTKLGPFEYV